MIATNTISECCLDFCGDNSSYNFQGNLIAQEGAGGELISDGDYYREYNALHQLVRLRKKTSTGKIIEEYSYGPNGERIMTVNFLTNTTIYTPFKEWMMIQNKTGTYNYTYVYDGSTLVARINPDGSKWFYHDDHLGSTSLITDENGTIVEETFYTPFGQTISGGEQEAYLLYTNQMKDSIGCYDYDARVYCPNWYHFTSADPVTANVFDPQGLNRYAYVKNNPYKYVDPDGENPLYFVVAAGVGAMLGGGYEMYSQVNQGTEFSNLNWNSIGKASLAGAFGGLFVAGTEVTLAAVGISKGFIVAGTLALDFLLEVETVGVDDTDLNPIESQQQEMQDVTETQNVYDSYITVETNPGSSGTPGTSDSDGEVKGVSAARANMPSGYTNRGSEIAAAGNNPNDPVPASKQTDTGSWKVVKPKKDDATANKATAKSGDGGSGSRGKNNKKSGKK